MNRRDRLAQEAVKAALRLRAQYGRSLDEPVGVVDLALDMGLNVRFEPIPSLEGMYSPEGPSIVLGSLRPPGRRNYTCGHEVGHHVFGHGLRIDELLDGQDEEAPKSDEEYLADRFSAALMMPKLAVERALATRGWKAERCGPDEIYVLAGMFGVGYATLVGQLHGTLNLLSSATAKRLRVVKPKAIRAALLGTEASKGLIVVGSDWLAPCIDAEVADLLFLPSGSVVKGSAVVLDHKPRGLWRAVSPGTCKVRSGAWTAVIRVARAAYWGLAEYRHIEDPDDDE
jgi:Zn-dependent peptidase ImmA (M78 family)